MRGKGDKLTLGIHEVADRDGVVTLNSEALVSEHSFGMSSTVGASAHILLTNPLHLSVERDSLQLLRQRNLLEFHLVNSASLGGAEKSSCQKSSLHAGPLLVMVRIKEENMRE
jgi:hypothetical protein